MEGAVEGAVDGVVDGTLVGAADGVAVALVSAVDDMVLAWEGAVDGVVLALSSADGLSWADRGSPSDDTAGEEPLRLRRTTPTVTSVTPATMTMIEATYIQCDRRMVDALSSEEDRRSIQKAIFVVRVSWML